MECCDGCGEPFKKGESRHHDPDDGAVYHFDCFHECCKED